MFSSARNRTHVYDDDVPHRQTATLIEASPKEAVI